MYRTVPRREKEKKEKDFFVNSLSYSIFKMYTIYTIRYAVRECESIDEYIIILQSDSQIKIGMIPRRCAAAVLSGLHSRHASLAISQCLPNKGFISKTASARARKDRGRGIENRSLSNSTKSTITRTRSARAASRKVYANAEVNLDKIDVFGFDYDYTLATYTSEVQHLIYEIAKGYLLERLRYPSALEESVYDPNFCIRGLVFDRRNGTLLKLSHRQIVTPGAVFRGRQRLMDEEVVKLYNSTLHLPHSYIRQHCIPVPDMFALAQGCLLSDVMQLAVDLSIPHDPYWLHQDVRKAIEYTHASGKMHGAIQKDVDRFIQPNPELRKFLERAVGAKKKLFLLTNSPIDFVDAGMKYLVGRDWMNLFNVSIFEASKPGFFLEAKPFRSLDATRSFVKWGTVLPDDVQIKGRALVGGSVGELLRLTGWGKMGHRVLYFGDHVFADLAEPARQTGWTTGAIVRELEHEIRVLRR